MSLSQRFDDVKRRALLAGLRRRGTQDGDTGFGLDARVSHGRQPLGEKAQYDDVEVKERIGDAFGIQSQFFLEQQDADGPRAVIGGRACVNFAAYDYCGLNHDPRVRAAAVAATERWGISPGASRINAGSRPPHAELERALATHYSQEAALLFVSGHATNVSTIATLVGAPDVVVHDALAHNSVVQGCILSGARRLSAPHNDLSALNTLLARARPQARHALIVVEGHYGMDGDVADLPGLIDIARRHRAYLMVDEAHSLGAIGRTGRGLAEHWGVDPAEVDIWMGTMSKTLAGCGGYIASNAATIGYLWRNTPGHVYSVGNPTPVVAASLKALEILHAEPERVARLHTNAKLFLDLARTEGLDTGTSIGAAIVPAIVGSALTTAAVAWRLYEQGIFVMPVLPPGVPDASSRLRFFFTAAHGEAEIRTAVRATAETLRIVRAERRPLG